jgi:WD40 repeat protein/serine/threonine protein kinase
VAGRAEQGNEKRWPRDRKVSENSEQFVPLNRLGDFRILRVLGRGGMGVVYEAEQVSLGRRVALKVLPSDLSHDLTRKARFEREARAAARLHHTNIVPVFGVGEHDGQPYYVMQLINGSGLDVILAILRCSIPQAGPVTASVLPVKDGPAALAARSLLTGAVPAADPDVTTAASPAPEAPSLAPPPDPPHPSPDLLPGLGDSSPSGTRRNTYWHSVARIGIQAADALDYAHKQGVLHRDIKPSNLLLDTQNTIWVADFGLAKADDQANLTQSGDILGTLRYMPPEAFEGQTDRRSDIYALGLTLYELLALRPAFDESDRNKIVKQVMTTEPARLDRLNPAIPRDLVTIIHKAADRDPERRYQTAGELAADLRRFLADEPIRARPISGLERFLRWARRNRGVAAALAAIAVILLAVTVLSSIAAVQFGRLANDREAARIAADEERDRAERSADEARRRGDAERWQRYRANIAAAAGALQLQNIDSARSALEASPVEFRNWEWQHLDSQLDTSQVVLRGHDASADDVAWSPDGQRLASASRDGAIRLWEAATGRERTLVRSQRLRGFVAFLAFTPDGRRLVGPGPSENTLRLWDLVADREIAVLSGHDRQIRAWAIRCDGKQIASGAMDGQVRLWDGETGQAGAVLRGHDEVLGLAYRPDGRLLATGGFDRVVRLWNTTTGREVAVLRGHTAGVWAVAWSPDGRRLVSAGDYPDQTLRLWDVSADEPKLLAVLPGHKNRVYFVQFSPDGTRIVSAGMDQEARLWRGDTGQLIATLTGHTDTIYQARFSPDGRRILTASGDKTLRLWDAATGELISVLRGHTGAINSAVFHPNGVRIASASADQTVRLWDVALAERNGVLRGHDSFVYDAAFTPDGNRLASAAWDGTVRVWDATTGRQTSLFKLDGPWATSVAINAEGTLLAALVRERGVEVWDLPGGRRRYQLAGPTGYWRIDTRAVFSPREGLLAAGDRDGTIHLWEAATGKPLATLHGHQGCVSDVAFSPDGKLLASSGEDGSVRLWAALDRVEVPIITLRGHNGLVLGVAFSADGRLLASASDDKTVRLWDAHTHEPIATLAHGSTVYRVAFAPDGTRLAAACADNTVRLWDLTTREEVAELRGHTSYVHAVDWSPDGTRLISASGDGTVRVWDSLSPQVRARPTDAYVPPRGYVCHRAAGPVAFDGRLDEGAWKDAAWTDDFVDIEGDRRLKPRFRTRAKMLWDERYFYIGAELEEPHVWATLTQHDSVIFRDNDFEVFIDPDGDNHNYAELELNALNTTWDLRLPKPYKDEGKADDAWEIEGLKTAVHVHGTLNDPRDTDHGWTVEIAIPWEAMGKLTDVPAPPRDGDQWRVNFSRVEWRTDIVDGKYRKVPHRREDNWVWSPQGVVNMHRPETWSYVQFSTAEPGTAAFRPDPAGPGKHLLHRIYYAQAAFQKEHGRFARTLAELGLADVREETLAGPPTLEVDGEHFQATADVKLPGGGSQRWRIREDSLVRPVKPGE